MNELKTFLFIVVASIEEVARRFGIPKAFIGLVLLPIVVRMRAAPTNYCLSFPTIQSNAAEHVTSVWMALKNKTELTIGICVGSSIVSAYDIFEMNVILTC